MTPETISFASHRWARATKCMDGTRLAYGVGKVCSSSCFFLKHTAALVAKARWIEHGIEPRAAETLTGLYAITDEQVEAWRFEIAAAALDGVSEVNRG